ncbi:MAG TPA: hypothetical protein DEB39_13000 [Planctomycetaceae bacterium]|nr:hypothetical protein [Planctomycetaceae bacterium]
MKDTATGQIGFPVLVAPTVALIAALLVFVPGIATAEGDSSWTMRPNSIHLSMSGPHRIVLNRLTVQQPNCWNLPPHTLPYGSEEANPYGVDEDADADNSTVRGQIGCFSGDDTFWINAVHWENTTFADDRSSGYGIAANGLVLGRDWMRGPSSRLGIAGGYDNPELRQRDGATRDRVTRDAVTNETRADHYHLGLYYQENFYGTELNCWIGYGHQEIDSRRYGYDDERARGQWYRGSTEGDTLISSVELGKITCYHGCFFVRPCIGVNMIHGWQYGFAEQATGNYGRLHYGRMHLEQTFLRVGASVQYEKDTWLRALLRIEYAYLMEGDPVAGSRARLIDKAGTPHVSLFGASVQRDFLTLGCGGQCSLGSNGSRYIYGDYDISMSSGRTVQAWTLGYIEKF